MRGLRVGDRVADLTVVGSNAAYRTLRADRLTRMPAGLDAAEAATVILSWTTAYQFLHRAARVQRGHRVPVLAKWRNWRESGVTRPAPTFRPGARLRGVRTRGFFRRDRGACAAREGKRTH